LTTHFIQIAYLVDMLEKVVARLTNSKLHQFKINLNFPAEKHNIVYLKKFKKS